ncbi:MAG: 16S rRNA methyltransferase [Candidatus Thorarchaeota archaeon]
MLHIILLNCALELVPRELASKKEVQRHANKRGKKSRELLLDQTHHGRAMTKMQDGLRRGRPDIVFHSLMSLLETPLCKAGLLTVHLHLQDESIIEVNPEVRLPRHYDRFVGLMEQLLLNGRVPPTGTPLMQIIEKSLDVLIGSLTTHSDSLTVLTVEGGNKTTIDALGSTFPKDTSTPVVVGIGAFPHGVFPTTIPGLFTTHIELDKEVMMAWHVCAETLWTYSLKAGVIRQRYRDSPSAT